MLGHKILHCIFQEKLLKFTVQLPRKSLIMRYYQRRFLELLYDICHSKSLTETGDSQQSLELSAFLEALHKSLYGLGLIAGGLVFTVQFEVHTLKITSQFNASLSAQIIIVKLMRTRPRQSSFDYSIPVLICTVFLEHLFSLLQISNILQPKQVLL